MGTRSIDGAWAYFIVGVIVFACGGSVDAGANTTDGRSAGGQTARSESTGAAGLGAGGEPNATGGLTAVIGAGALGGENTRVAQCGDGRLDPGEECDDYIAGYVHAGGDGCSLDCKLEPGWTCPVVGVPCKAGPCGDGILGVYETCDDGNTSSGDGCLGDCSDLEPGWACPRAGLRCVPVCGDGVITGSEQCDDGGREAFDGCSSHCSLENGGACAEAQPNCVGVSRCGDGVLGDDEECDDGAANGDEVYGGCTRQCRLGPRCGDQIVNGPEACDLGPISGIAGAPYGSPGCTKGCQFERYCGDGYLDDAFYEQCDWGRNNTSDPWSPLSCRSTCWFNSFIGP